MIKLKEGQKVLDEDGNIYLIEKGDVIEEGKIVENSRDSAIKRCANDAINYITLASQKAAKKFGLEDESKDMMEFQMDVYKMIGSELSEYL